MEHWWSPEEIVTDDPELLILVVTGVPAVVCGGFPAEQFLLYDLTVIASLESERFVAPPLRNFHR